ncbi:hypothetical protein LWI28_022558 [Acer negundo]|uniref:Retrotransposon Copia-like N-terminal domain-containing protein n=1 Tax=Acer negundo TaxID=4023 RepID=A0AAD5IFM9_ACENE|nr:hypothetical protein LWI28_022558 [Acer negundo]
MATDEIPPTSSVTGKEVAFPSTSIDPSKANISNPSNPFFTHHSDHPGLVLISKPLNGDNYSTWKRAMTLALNSKNKLGFVNGSIKAPSEEINPEGYAKDLRERFSQSNAPRIFEIQRDIAYLRQEQLSVSTYYTKLKGLWDELDSYNDTVHRAQQDQQKLMQFLMGLNDSYSTVRGQILLMNPLPSIRQTNSSVSHEEKQRLLGSSNTAGDTGSSAAMAVRSNSSSKSTSARPEHHTHKSQDFRSHDKQPENFSGGRKFQGQRRSETGRGRLHCSHCGEMGHWIQTCYELHGYPVGHPKAKHSSGPKRFSNIKANHVANGPCKEDGNQFVGISEAQLKQLLSLLDSNNKNEGSSSQANVVTKPGLSKVTSRNWIIDSGATDHISSLSTLFYLKNNKCSLPPVLLPSGDKANIVAKGSLPLNSVYYLHDVLCVPTFKVDLIFVPPNFGPTPPSHKSGPIASPPHIYGPNNSDLTPSVLPSHDPISLFPPPPILPLTSPSSKPPTPPFTSSPLATAPEPDPAVDLSLQSPISSPDPSPPMLHRSSRQAGPPVKLSDYVCSNVSLDQSTSLLPGPLKGTRYPLANFVSYHRYTPDLRSFTAQIDAVSEPRSYSEAAIHLE